MTYNGERQCPWKRRMTKDGKHFARIILTTKGFVIQKGMVALSACQERAQTRAQVMIGEPDTFGIHVYWTVFCLYLDCIL